MGRAACSSSCHSCVTTSPPAPSLPQLHPKKGAGQAGQQVLDLLMDHAENHVATSTVSESCGEDEARWRRGGEGRAPSVIAAPPAHVAPHRLSAPPPSSPPPPAVIAGYEDEVRDLMAVNAGFGSRFPPEGWFHFSDYSEVQVRGRQAGRQGAPDTLAWARYPFAAPRDLPVHRRGEGPPPPDARGGRRGQRRGRRGGAHGPAHRRQGLR